MPMDYRFLQRVVARVSPAVVGLGVESSRVEAVGDGLDGFVSVGNSGLVVKVSFDQAGLQLTSRVVDKMYGRGETFPFFQIMEPMSSPH